ncbi:MAG: hypothetical protein ACHQNT_12760 [Bacteroidia bacterium]
MRTVRTSTILLLLGLTLGLTKASAQKSILRNVDFDKGDWRLFGMSYENEKNTLQDSLGNFFTNDMQVLKKMQSMWKLKKHNGMYACGYHYKFLFIKNDSTQFDWMLNLDCNEICGEYGCFEFSNDMLRAFYKDLKKIPQTKYLTHSLDTARKLFTKLKSIDTVLTFSDESNYWIKFPGFVKVTVIDSIIDNYVKIDGAVKAKIKEDYPNEVFEIKKGSSTHPPKAADIYEYYIYCSESMGQSFKTYAIKKKWKPFDSIKFSVFGLTEQDINQIKLQL